MKEIKKRTPIYRERNHVPTLEEFNQMNTVDKNYYRKKFPEMNYPYKYAKHQEFGFNRLDPHTPPTLEEYNNGTYERRCVWRKKYPEMNYPMKRRVTGFKPTIEEFNKLSTSQKCYYRQKFPDMKYPKYPNKDAKN